MSYRKFPPDVGLGTVFVACFIIGCAIALAACH